MRCVQPAVLALLLLTVCGASGARSPDSESIAIAVVDDHYELTVPVGHVTMLLPRGHFERQQSTAGGSAKSSRYFLLRDQSTGAIVTGWFESGRDITDAGKALEESWPVEVANLNKAGRTPLNIERKTIGAWHAITYKFQIGDLVSSHIRASQIVGDTWVDLHLSVSKPSTDESTDASVMDLLKSLSFRTR